MNTNLSQTHVEKTEQLAAASAEQPLEQTGGSKTPIPSSRPDTHRLRTKVKATDQDTGLVWDVGMRRKHLLDDVRPVWTESTVQRSIDVLKQSRPQVACASLLL